MTKRHTTIRHVTKRGANLFSELGFAPREAKRLQALSRNEIDQALKVKKQLMDELAAWIETSNLRQEDAASILKVTRPRVSDVVNHKTAKFTIDALVSMLARIGKPVRVVVG